MGMLWLGYDGALWDVMFRVYSVSKDIMVMV